MPPTSKALRIAQTLPMLAETNDGQIILRALQAHERTLRSELANDPDNLAPAWMQRFDEWCGTRVLISKLGGRVIE